MKKPTYSRILLKLSGEVLAGSRAYGTDPGTLVALAQEIKEVSKLGVEIGVVLGGGNLFRGVQASSSGMDRTRADHIGMIATVMNCLTFQDILTKQGLSASVLSALDIRGIVDPFAADRAIQHLEQGHVVLLAGGTGNPYFTTDTAAALRAMEIRAEAILKGTKVEGVYSEDPEQNPSATFYRRVSYMEILRGKLKVMDLTAVSLCMEADLPLHVFNIRKQGNLLRILKGEAVGSIVSS